MADGAAQFIYFLRPKRLEMLTKGPTAEESRIQLEHASHLEGLASRGVVVLAGRTTNNDETNVGLVVVNATDERAAREIMENDPFVKNDLMTASLLPFRVAYRS
jgi:uncharacterized protein YciI